MTPDIPRTVWLTSAYLAPVQYYTKIYAAERVVEERAEPFLKQTYRNRCVIAGPQGPLALTIPVEHDGKGLRPTRDIRISDHGNWRHLHWTAMVSAYRNSPYFDYYADDFAPLYTRRFEFLTDFNAALREVVTELLGIRTETVINDTQPCDTDVRPEGDFRGSIRPKAGHAGDAHFRPAPYYQVFAPRTGFLPNLSIADLLFNMGPEARIVLRDSIV